MLFNRSPHRYFFGYFSFSEEITSYFMHSRFFLVPNMGPRSMYPPVYLFIFLHCVFNISVVNIPFKIR